jgi:dTDP-D-glucose 4,6-dehydratase
MHSRSPSLQIVRGTTGANAIDPSHAEVALGWKPAELIETGLAKTIDWYIANDDWLIPVKELGRLGTRGTASAEVPQ